MSTDISREAAEDAAEAFRRWRSEQHRWDKDSEAEDCLRRLILSAIDRATAALREENARLKGRLADHDRYDNIQEMERLRSEAEEQQHQL